LQKGGGTLRTINPEYPPVITDRIVCRMGTVNHRTGGAEPIQGTGNRVRAIVERS